MVHIWKNNSVALRFWINLCKNPTFLFDITTPASMTGNLSVIAQVMMDACSTSKQNLNPSSPANKLMYRAEVAKYKKKVKKLYTTTIDTTQSSSDSATYVPINANRLEGTQLPPFTPDSAALTLLR